MRRALVALLAAAILSVPLTVSAAQDGSETVAVPDLGGSRAEAEAIFAAAGLIGAPSEVVSEI